MPLPLTAVYSGDILLWDYDKGQLLRSFKGHTGTVFTLEITEHVLISGHHHPRFRGARGF